VRARILLGKRATKLVGCRPASSLSPIEAGYVLNMPVIGSIFDLTVSLLEIFIHWPTCSRW